MVERLQCNPNIYSVRSVHFSEESQKSIGVNQLKLKFILRKRYLQGVGAILVE